MIKLIKSISVVSGSGIKKLVLPVILSCMDAIFNMMMFSMMILTIIDLAIGDFTQEKLIQYSLILLALFIIRAILYGINYAQIQYRGADITKDIRIGLGNHIRSLNLGFFNKNSIGRLTSTLTTDIADFEKVVTHSLSSLFKTIFFSLLAIFFAFLIDVSFALVLLVLILVSIPVVGLSGRLAKSRGGDLRKSAYGVISRIVEYLNGIKTFKLYNLTGIKFKRLDYSFRKLKKDSIRLELSIMPASILFSLITSLMIPIALLIGTSFLISGALDTTRFIAVVMLAISISNMMVTLASLFPEMNYLMKATENILKVMNEKPLGYQKETFKFTDSTIAFNQVHFSYTDEVEVLHDLNFIVPKGTTTALIGPSGSGKTTIISLISRFWDVSSGSITIGGENIRDIAPDGLTSQMAVVFQEVYLLNDTIAANIRVGKKDASMEAIIEAAKSAQCHEFIMALPDGYETMVGEGGSTLSGGEKQRISIARALIKEASIVLLDESTSSLDADNELEINRALDYLMKNKTVIVIAHRLNTIRYADNILVLEGGRIKEEGNHQSLLAQNGWYKKMIDEQEKAREWVVQ